MCIFVASAHLMKPFLLVVIYHLLIAKFIVLQFWNDVIYSAQMKFKLLDHMFPKSVFQNLKTMLIGVQSWWSDNLGCLCKVVHICTIFTTQEDVEKRWEHNILHEESQCNMSSVNITSLQLIIYITLDYFQLWNCIKIAWSVLYKQDNKQIKIFFADFNVYSIVVLQNLYSVESGNFFKFIVTLFIMIQSYTELLS